MRIGDATTSGLVLLAAGAWQLSSLQRACLTHCRSPVDFLARHRRADSNGSFVTGLHHALYSLGCCWALMVLLFVGGAMNIWWIAGLALFVFVEKRWVAGVIGLDRGGAQRLGAVELVEQDLGQALPEPGSLRGRLSERSERLIELGNHTATRRD